ncbi:hypothetical protein TNCV_479121 [Trichonephila clavipes]|nr:hypothetical protein TNCV_479121 [Trichonephila clavipes]
MMSHSQSRALEGRVVHQHLFSPSAGVWKKLLSGAGISMIAFPPYSGSESVKDHRALSMKDGRPGGRVVAYYACTPQVWGSILGLSKVDSAFHLFSGFDKLEPSLLGD